MSENLCPHICRNDFVLLRVVDKGRVSTIITPQVSAQGKERIVLAVGPKVKDLAVGDSVFIIGSLGQDVVQLPNESDVYITKESNVVLVVRKDK